MDQEENPNLDTTIHDLTIPFKKTIVNRNIPSLPMNCIAIGRSGSGKTASILNLLEFYKKHFKNRILIFAPTPDMSLYNLCDTMGAQIFLDIGDKIRRTLEFQKQQKLEGKKLKHILMYFEDFISNGEMNKRRSAFTELFSTARHYKISVLITGKSFSLIPSSLRRMAWNFLIFKITNTREKKLMIDELCGTLDMTENEFEETYDSCVSEPYSFIYIDTVKGKWLKRFGK